jgi:hypothetical protein
MLLFGHRFIDSPRFYHVDDIESIVHTPANSILFIPFDESNLDIAAHCRDNGLTLAIEAGNLREVIYAENLGGSFIVVEPELAKSAQKAADAYLFDAKVLCRIEEEEMIEELAEAGIDGVIFGEAIVKISG